VSHIVLIAINFVREQRWPILVLMLWIVVLSLLGLFIESRVAREDVLFIFKQGAVYGVVFAVFFGGSAIHNERKTRRILAVLSKSVGRGEYVSGLLAGIALSTGIYWFSMGVTATWILGGEGLPVPQLWGLILCLSVASMLSATVAVLFSTILNPLFATMATFVALVVPGVLALRFGSSWTNVVPAFSLISTLMGASLDAPLSIPWSLMLLGITEAICFWLGAWWIFSKRDIAVAVD